MQKWEEVLADAICFANATTLRKLIINNAPLTTVISPFWIKTLLWLGGVRKRDFEQTSIEEVLQCIRKSRPDIYEIFVTEPKGMAWLEYTIEEVKEMAP